MVSVGSVLISQGHELISARLQSRGQPQNSSYLWQWVGGSVVILTVLAFGSALFWVDYTCNHVIATLAAVEDSNPDTYVRLDCGNSNDSCDPDGTEVAGASTTKPITSGLRSAVKHLGARGGIWSYFRGFRMYLAFTGWDLGLGFLLPSFVPVTTHSLISLFVGRFVASMLLATWHMAWVHLVIADQSPKSSYRRMLGLRYWPRIAPAAALYNGLMCATSSLPIAAAELSKWPVMNVTTPRPEKFLGFLVKGILPAILFLVLSIPARAIFTRVAASMLPEEDDPIVPFDRRFGGKVKPATVGGDSGHLSLQDAWTSFDRAACIRYVKVTLKVLAIEVALGVVGILLIMGEVTLTLKLFN
ncbi:hypothetical protein BDV27DRAFT_122898 [Aspergillus caelatus]|uniref:Ubiquitin carrier protein n=1 Tax=Aspergillus caelatus TaxID=61420 RepID=A0A5N7AFC3_9EURO|nr:uncharacterized protein BDV27DRAFT_122898 [Aspergillus caelatus]KAE8368028.1 hypothetical protein BDV27DRAFT_122898 [Aspergillus caelatus]